MQNKELGCLTEIKTVTVIEGSQKVLFLCLTDTGREKKFVGYYGE